MERAAIKALALAHGFKLKPQPDGTEDLNEYVYTTIEAALAQASEERAALCAAIKMAARLGMRADTTEQLEDLVVGIPTLTRNAAGELVVISLQDDEHRMLAILWERPTLTPRP